MDILQTGISATMPAAEHGRVQLNGAWVHYTILRSARRRKTVALRVGQDQTLLITAPLRSKKTNIEALLKCRAVWLSRKLAEVKQFHHLAPASELGHGANIPYLGTALQLHMIETDKKARLPFLQDDRLQIMVASEKAPAHDLRGILRLWYKREARRVLKQRLDIMAARMGLRYNRFVLTSAGSRWGSCNARNVIRLSWRLIMAPPHVIDYVAAHELAHVLHKNHSPRFWQVLAQTMPDHLDRRAELNRMATALVF